MNAQRQDAEPLGYLYSCSISAGACSICRTGSPAPAKMRGDLAGWLSAVEALTAHHATLGVHRRQLDVCGRRGADVRPDFNWIKPATSWMRYR